MAKKKKKTAKVKVKTRVKTRKTASRPKPKRHKTASKKTTKGKPAKTKRRKKDTGGGQTKYRVSFPERALTYAEVGQFAHSRLAKKFKVSVPTIKNWIDMHPKFAEAVEEGEKIAVAAVDSTHYQLALGIVKVKKGNLPPNQRACEKILTANIEKYKNKQELSGPDGKPLLPIQVIIKNKEVQK
ncbi:hypothetical protein LCGC14_0403610 [marine sediment metagenome]|uniref:Terminase small subunit n=1 Tax=marine sediment metagenome TaxID=412755 RepID=A0A0F9W557_9ZZZZ